jgi:hypothetical protein
LLQQLDRYRAGLGERLRQVSDQLSGKIIEGELAA